jgi:TonB family protein
MSKCKLALNKQIYIVFGVAAIILHLIVIICYRVNKSHKLTMDNGLNSLSVKQWNIVSPAQNKVKKTYNKIQTLKSKDTKPISKPKEQLTQASVSNLNDPSLASYKMGSGRNPYPIYPKIAQARGISGHVDVFVMINMKDGRVIQANIKTSSGYDVLDKAAVDTIEKWIFDVIPNSLQTYSVVIPVDFILK